MKYFSMFSGIGGFELGIQQAFDNRPDLWNGLEDLQDHSSDSAKPQARAVCIGYSEIDKYAIATYEHNFGKETKNFGDATTINTAELPDFDLLVGGFPCQAFSIAGKRAGFDDTRGTLIFDVVRILRDKRPRYFVLENVKGLLSHESGKTFSHILEVLTDSGYDVSWSVHNSKNYGVPQNKERIYLIGNLIGERRPQVFPITQDDRAVDEGSIKGVQQANTLRARDYASWRGNHIQQLNQPTHSNDRVYGPGGVSPTLNTMQGGNRQPFITQNSGDIGKRKTSKSDISYTLRATPSSDGGQKLHINEGIRRLTPTECERLQGFPDSWTQGSDTQRYKQCGNAITVNVFEHVAKELIPCL